jgi:hypothetical protein
MAEREDSRNILRMKAEEEIEEAQYRLNRAESSTARAKGLLALSTSFLERGEYAEATNLAVLARLELSRLAPTLSEEKESSDKRTITYLIAKTKEPEEALWVSQSERVVFLRSLEELADELELKIRLTNEPPGVMQVVLEKGGEVLARIQRSAEVKEDGVRVKVEVECDDREIFKAIFLFMKDKFIEISQYLKDVRSEPLVPVISKDDFIARLKVRDQANVEEILVLHEDGRLMCHISAFQAEEVDYDILGSMILALQSFVRDSFRKEFDELGFSGKRILLVPGKNIKVAFVLKGESSDGFKKNVVDSIVKLELALGKRLSAWRGEMTIANEISPYLEVYVRGGRVLIGGG